jgi:hypothetical protein
VFSNDAVRCVAKPTIAGGKGSNICCKLTQYKTEPPGCGQTPLPNALFRAQRPKMIRKVSNFDQTTTQNEETFRKGGALGWERSMTKAEQFRENAEEAMQLCRQSRTEDAKKVLTDLALTWTQAAALSERKSVGPPEPGS